MIGLDPMALSALLTLTLGSGVGIGASARFPKRPPVITDPDLLDCPVGPIIRHGQARWK